MSAGITGHNPHGAGEYGRESTSHVTACVHSKNPFGHNKECNCGWWARELASQTIPYLPPSAWVNVPEPDYPESPHGPL